MRRRLVIAIAAVAAAAVVLFAVPLALVLSNGYRDEDLLRLQRDTIAATRGIDVSGQQADPIELPRSADVLAVYDAKGRRVAGPLISRIAHRPFRARSRLSAVPSAALG